MGLPKSKRPSVYGRPAVKKHWASFQSSPDSGNLKKWCFKNKVLMGALIRGMIKQFPGEWEAAKESVGEILVKKCRGCGLDFYANTKLQGLCQNSCGVAVWPSHTKRKSSVASGNGTEDPTR